MSTTTVQMPSGVNSQRVAVSDSEALTTSTLVDDMFRTFEEENSRLRALLKEQKKFRDVSDQLIESNKQIRRDINSLRVELALAEQSKMVPTVKRFLVGNWNAVCDTCNAVDRWFSEIEEPIGWMACAGLFAAMTAVAVVREINRSGY
ncbi:hypothetical protein CRE_24532 [Caenorhabditis remanei]|uniref:Uncharacterized protein n=1 Tax=Caenorhabditis remanei TaxID=31234 RepID=E3MV93_CAERE|nr:hypothetical protein CRE_24532 [Caenorhabditis remanei]